MANWDNYTQKSTPEDADTLMIKDTAGAANKRTPFSGVWNWIVSKLTSAVISQLETTNKSIIPAINELNGKCQTECEMIFNETEEIKDYYTEIPENSIIFACKKTDVSTASIFTFNSDVTDLRINFIGTSNNLVPTFNTNLIQIAPNVIVRIYKFK